MNLTVFACGDAVLAVCECIKGYAFKAAPSWEKFALLAKLNHQLSAVFANAGVQSVHFYTQDCFECLSPHMIAA